MATNIRVEQFRPEYSENLCPSFSMFNDAHTWNILSGGVNGGISNSTSRSFEGDRSMKVTFSGTGVLVFTSGGTEMNFTATHTGSHIISSRFFIPIAYSGSDVVFRIYMYINGIAFSYSDFNGSLSSANGFVYDEWNTFAQSMNLTAGDVVSFEFKAVSDTIGVELYFDGLKAEYDDRNLGIPSIYSKPKDFCCSDTKGYVKSSDLGWASYVDTLHTVGSPQLITEGVTPVLLTNNSATTISSQLPDGVVKLFDQATTKITPVAENDFNSVDIMFKVKNSVLNGYFTIYVDIPTLGSRFEQTFICPKNSGTEMGVNYSFHHYVSSQFAANGGIIYVVANSGNLQIYDKQYRIARIIKAK